jgi:isocitrate dehydrogenase (NAD+)
MIITRFGAERIVRYAFEYAVSHGRKKVTLAHKANILKYTQGLFLDVGREVAKEYEGRVEFEDRIIDATAMLLVLNPYQFDVLVMENMFGDILSDQMAGLVGGLGMAPGGNIGKDAAIFEPVHGSAPDIAGRGIANPTAMVLAGCMMLEHLGQHDVAQRVRTAVRSTLEARQTVTPDVGGKARTEEFADAVIRVDTVRARRHPATKPNRAVERRRQPQSRRRSGAASRTRHRDRLPRTWSASAGAGAGIGRQRRPRG